MNCHPGSGRACHAGLWAQGPITGVEAAWPTAVIDRWPSVEQGGPCGTVKRCNGPMDHVFLSYSRLDRDLARRLRDDLVSGRVDVWSDRELGLGGRWLTEISDAISRSRALILLASPAALGSKWVMREVDAAQTLGIPVIPLLAGGARYGDLPVNLAGVNGVDLAEGYEESVDMIVAVLGGVEYLRGEVAKTGQDRTLLLLAEDEEVAFMVGDISRSIGLVVDRPRGERAVLSAVLNGPHIAVIDDCFPFNTSFVAGYVAGRGGWVICLVDEGDSYLPSVPGIGFSPSGRSNLEREICAAAFLPARSSR